MAKYKLKHWDRWANGYDHLFGEPLARAIAEDQDRDCAEPPAERLIDVMDRDGKGFIRFLVKRVLVPRYLVEGKDHHSEAKP